MIFFPLDWLLALALLRRPSVTGNGKATGRAPMVADEGHSLDVAGERVDWRILKSGGKFAVEFYDGREWRRGSFNFATLEDAEYQLFEAINEGRIRREF